MSIIQNGPCTQQCHPMDDNCKCREEMLKHPTYTHNELMVDTKWSKEVSEIIIGSESDYPQEIVNIWDRLTDDEYFDKWYEQNELRFHHGQFEDKAIAYSAFLEGIKYKKKRV